MNAGDVRRKVLGCSVVAPGRGGHEQMVFVSSSPRSSAESVSALAKSPDCMSSSAFSNPTLHSAAVHHRNLQAAAAAAQQLHQLNSLALTGLNFNPLVAQQGASTAHSQLAIHNLLPHFPLLNNVAASYNPLLQAQLLNPLSK